MMRCSECGAQVDDRVGPVHEYVPAAAGCWALLLALQGQGGQPHETAPPGLVVDTYLAQRPGDGTDARARRSPLVHLAGLYARLEAGLDHAVVLPLLQRIATSLRQEEVVPLTPRTEAGRLNVAVFVELTGPEGDDAGEDAAFAWAREVWRTWAHEHPRIRALYDQAWRG